MTSSLEQWHPQHRLADELGAITAPACASRNSRSIVKCFENAAPPHARTAAAFVSSTRSTYDFLVVMWTQAAFRRARETGAQKWLRDAASLNASVGKCRPAPISFSVGTTPAPLRAAAIVAAAQMCMRSDHRD